MEKIIDLHIHSNISDGFLSPKEIIDAAKKNNIHTISIADHDTIDAYSDEFLDYAKKNNINIIPAVEISSKQNKIGIHILGYNFDINNETFKVNLEKIRNARHYYLESVSQKLTELGYIVNVTKLDKIKSVTKANIANDIIENPKNYDLLIREFNHIPSKGEFIETIMNEGCIAYVEKNSITPKEAAKHIRSAGGKVVLAHPVAYKYEDDLNISDIKNIIDEINPDGIEAYYLYVDRYNNKINEIEKWKTFAYENNKFVTVGSDYHNNDGIHPFIGFINDDINISIEDINTIINNLLN